ncbi:hypothetical protein [Cytobacillus gottheilii]|uniref:hypothetical protein n=1 Tax=Cytobacillus gottheilii TaxID=859144 RepID=UPI0009BA9659|nr:hypothetical protein [Cytobacillus gottheilii]
MPSISKIRFTNVVYEDGLKRYNDEIFRFDGYNGAILLENGGGKTVFIQTALQAIIPHTNLSDRKIKQTLQLDNYPAHIAIEWILSENPRRYLLTCVSLFLTKDGLSSYRYVYPYMTGDQNSIEGVPFVKKNSNRPSDRGEIADYYQYMTQQYMNARTFSTIKAYQEHLEEQYHIIANEWESIVKINSTEGGVEAFFDDCRQTNQLFDRLLVPTVESAIAGHEENSFADTFEKQRTSFKLYKELKQQIEENKAIEAQLNDYVSRFSRVDAEWKAYEQKKQHAKAVLHLILEKETQYEQSLNDVKRKKENWREEERLYLQKDRSLHIEKAGRILAGLQDQLHHLNQELNEEKDQYEQASNQYIALKFAELKLACKQEEDQIQSLREQLDSLNEAEEVQELEERILQNQRELLGLFLNEMEESDRRIAEIQYEKRPIEEKMAKFAQELKAERERLNALNDRFHTQKGKWEALQESMRKLLKKLLAHPEQENIKENISAWEKRLVSLDEEIVQLKNDHKQLAVAYTELENQLEESRQEKAKQEKLQTQLQTEIVYMDEEHNKVKAVLGGLQVPWATIDSVYLKQDSITQKLHDYLHNINGEVDQCLYKERLALRLMDDYGEQDLFFADPYLEKQLQGWKNQFHLLETGIMYIQNLESVNKEYAKKYPLWPNTLITTESETAALRQKVAHIRSKLQFPIEVLSFEQARAIVLGETIYTEAIVPAHWTENEEIAHFQDWKQSMKENADVATVARKEAEAKRSLWSQAAEKLSAFLQAYPYPFYQEKKEQLSKSTEAIQALKALQRDLHTQMADNKDKMDAIQSKAGNLEGEYNGLQKRLSDGHEYLRLEKDSHDISKTQKEYERQINERQQEIQSKEKTQERWKDQLQELEEKRIAEHYHYLSILDDEIYKEVKGLQASYTSKIKAVLLNERQELIFASRKLSSSQQELRLKLDFAQKEKDRFSEEIAELLQEHGPVQEEVSFVPNGKERMKHYRKVMKDRDQAVKAAEERAAACREGFVKQEKAVDIAKEQFLNDFPGEEWMEFEGEVTEIEALLVAENRQLYDKQRYLDQEEQRFANDYEAVKNAFHELDRFEEAHHFKGPSIQAAVLTQEEIRDFAYEHKAIVKKATKQLQDGKNKVTKERAKLDQAKELFKAFCKDQITDVKMREMARQGVDNKKTFKEIVEFQTNMQKRIQTAIHYNETTIMGYDRDLEQFVTRISNHLHTVAGELRLIPNKTKVKVADKWKEIYKFVIPDWSEEDGKSRIRSHIEWIVSQLDSDRFRTSDGNEDHGKVRKEIETWLQSKQLLRVVMNNEMMKVSCRKVTNDSEVTTRSYSWEQTNVWSGGEKWSKNMTLFLGLLNYVAEKQKHLDPNMKRNRVVILDNPFGKASSDHVLNPVFFIAEQLGFQMIALTAHAEGKFLRNYFPVIYSCRLRKAADTNKQIMTAVKQLHHAYFQDHEPQALERLGEVEQLELF